MTSEDLVEIRLVGLPLDVQRMTNAHYDALMREFELIRQSDNAAGTVPVRLLHLVDELSTRFNEFAEQPRAVLEAALESAGTTVDLVYQVPSELVDACHRLLDLLDEADAYCVAGEQLVTLSSPPVVRVYRHWFLHEFIEQAAGRAPTPWSEHVEPAVRPAASATVPIEAPVSDDAREPDADEWPTTVDGDKAIVMLAGELDLALAPSLRNHLNRLHAEGVRHFTLDAADVPFIDSVGLSVLVALYRRCRDEDGTVSLVGPSPPIRRTLEISGLLDVLNVR
jgi:stage II sporulation protein AA (anti-sigma F factor antagonist)